MATKLQKKRAKKNKQAADKQARMNYILQGGKVLDTSTMVHMLEQYAKRQRKLCAKSNNPVLYERLYNECEQRTQEILKREYSKFITEYISMFKSVQYEYENDNLDNDYYRALVVYDYLLNMSVIDEYIESNRIIRYENDEGYTSYMSVLESEDAMEENCIIATHLFFEHRMKILGIDMDFIHQVPDILSTNSSD